MLADLCLRILTREMTELRPQNRGCIDICELFYLLYFAFILDVAFFQVTPRSSAGFGMSDIKVCSRQFGVAAIYKG